MQIIGRKLNIREFREYVAGKYFGARPANKLVVHHTWKPTVAQWQGARSISGLKRYYEGKGWVTGPHLFVAPDGIWLFSDMRYDGTHAGVGNFRSIGIEVVGDYDQKVWSGAVKSNALAVIEALMEKLDLGWDRIKFHRDYAPYKTCPGKAITKTWLQNQIRQLNNFSKADKIERDSNDVTKTQEPMISDRLQSAIEKLTGKRYWSDFSESEQESAARELEDFYQKYHRLQAQVRDLKEEQNQKQDQKSGTAGSADSQVPTSKTSSKKTNSSSSSSSGKVRTKPYSEFNWLEKVIWNAKKIFRNK